MSESNEILDSHDDCPLLPRELFAQLGYEPLPPGQVDESQLVGRLWEFIYALAGRRFYLFNTNHLSDRELYLWLHDEWLPSEIRDSPDASGWNRRVSPAHADNAHAAEIYLRYYASVEDRERWALDFPEFPLPAAENAPYDRDRWLPEAPFNPLAGSEDPTEGYMDDPDNEEEDDDEDENEESARLDEAEDSTAAAGFDGFRELVEGANDPDREENDPLGLAAVDRQIREQKMLDQTADADFSLDDEEEDNLVENWERPRDVLQRAGVRLLPPAELTDESIPSHLWELLHNLACRGYFVQHSDHLTDRQLYEELWDKGISDLSLLPGKNSTGGWFHDVVGSFDPEDIALWLRYYADDEERAMHALEYPNEPLPPREVPLARRDWRLPKGPF